MLERGSAAAGGRLTSRLGLFLIAIILGALVPIAVVAIVAWRDPLPPSCRTGQATIPAIEGTILYTDQSVLWIIEGDLNHPRKLVDYGPPTPPTPSPGASAQATGATGAPAPATPSPATSPVPSASPSGPQPQIVAAAISSDHHKVAFVVNDPPGAPGKISGRTLDPLQATPTVTEVWNVQTLGASGRTEISFLDATHLLIYIPWKFDPPETSTRFVGVIQPGANPPVVQSASESRFVAELHGTWPETKGYRLPPQQPQVDSRVIGPGDIVGGLVSREVKTPLTDRTVQQVSTGHLGQQNTTTVCASFDGIAPMAFSPDAKTMALSGAGSSYLLDLSGGHAAVFLLRGLILDWRP